MTYKNKYNLWLQSEVVDKNTKQELNNLSEKEIEELKQHKKKSNGV